MALLILSGDRASSARPVPELCLALRDVVATALASAGHEVVRGGPAS